MAKKCLGVDRQYAQAESFKPKAEEVLANLEGQSTRDTFQIFMGVPPWSSAKTYQ